MILVDSGVWIDYFNGNDTDEVKKLDLYLGNYSIAIGDIILTEVLQGFKNDRDYQTAKMLLTSLRVYSLLGVNLAIKNAENYRFLRKKGITTRKTNDVIIATFCIENNIALLFSDKDFKPFVTHLNLISA
ncbi:PIN domain nuclease [Cyanobacterium aponinum UTEX 3222]|uniref:type II toxin-antitoxin system VapC family toxin n=1 Tax=Cyanobacterium aponinum TaxID=379064 RepID=UPI003086A8F2|nr:PIN domain nuclease [Cyanobacterium aponinum UTEX 3222]